MGDREDVRHGTGEERHRDLLDAIAEGLCVHEIGTGRIVEVNQRLAEMLGCRREDLVGSTETFPSDDAHYSPERAQEWMRRAIEIGPQVFAWRCRRRNGSGFDSEISLRHLRRDAEDLIVATVHDVSDRTRNERVWRVQEEQAEALLELVRRLSAQAELLPALQICIEEAVRLTGLDLGVVYLAEPDGGFRIGASTGLPPEMVARGRTLPPDSVQARVMARRTPLYLTAADTARVRREEFLPGDYDALPTMCCAAVVPIVHADRLVACLNAGSTELGDIPRPVQRLLESIAGQIGGAIDRLAWASERAELENQLREAQRLEAIGRLAGGIAHDFNNVLTVVQGNLSLALADLGAEQPLRTTLTEVRDAAERATVLTRQLLAFARRQLFELRPIDLNALLYRLERMLVRIIGEDVALTARLDPAVPTVLADSGQLEQVIVNLVLNARDAMPKGGELILETSSATLDDGYCSRHAGVEPGSYVLLSVTDTGSGMSPDVRARIFEPFFTTKPRDKGTGLGLPMVFGIVHQHHGFIDVESEPGRGTTVRIYLPTVDALPLSEQSAAADLPTGTETVLVVEDEALVRDVARRILTRLGYGVLEAANGGEALGLIERRAGPIHLLLTDVVMPGMSGRDLAVRLASAHPEMCVLYTSGYAETALGDDGVAEPGMHFIAKPYTPRALAQKVRAVLDTPRGS